MTSSGDAAAKSAKAGATSAAGLVTIAAGGLKDSGGSAVNNMVLVLLVILALGSALLAKLPDLAVASQVSMRVGGGPADRADPAPGAASR